MRDPDENGWASSAEVWIRRMRGGGDFARRHVLDRPMLERVRAFGPAQALDVGCGEGRFCRMLRELGVSTVGVDPVEAMIEAARHQDPEGRYHIGFAEDLPFEDGAFDMVVSYLTLIDIDELEAAAAETTRVLRPGGRLLIANLSSFATSSGTAGKRYCRDSGEELRPLGRYLETARHWFEWDELRIRNWHRPLSTYMRLFLEEGLHLRHFDEPVPSDGPPDRIAAYQRLPFLMIMEWEKQADPGP